MITSVPDPASRGPVDVARPRSPVRIARIIGRLNIGGPAIQAITLTHELARHGYETLLIRGIESPREGSMDHLAEALEVRPLLIPALRRDPGLRDLSALAALTRTMLRERPDIVHTHAAKAGTLGRVASMLASTASHVRPRPVLVHTFHGHSLTGYFSPRVSAVYRTIERTLARRTDKLIAVSEQVRDELVAMDVAPPAKFVVIPLGFDLARFMNTGPERDAARHRVRAEFGLSSDATVVTLIARLVPIKRVDRFLRAASLLNDLVDVRFLIVGDGELREGLERSDAARALEDRLAWAGFRRDIPAVCFASDLVVLSSDNEGTPVSLIEASAAGLPVISTNVGGAAAVVVDGRTGRLVNPDDGEDLASAIRALVRDLGLRTRMGIAAREHAARFSLERLTDDLDQLYRQLLFERDAVGSQRRMALCRGPSDCRPMSPQPSPHRDASSRATRIHQQEVAAARRYAPYYDEAYDTVFYSSHRRELIRRLHRLARSTAVDLSSARILDVGTGTGALLRDLGPLSNVRVKAIELSPELAALARQKHPTADIWVGPVEEAPYPSDSFDVVTGFSVLHHLADLNVFFAWLRQTLRPGGIFAFCEPNADTILDRAFWNTVSRRATFPLRRLLERRNRDLVAHIPDMSNNDFYSDAHRMLTAGEVAQAAAHPDLAVALSSYAVLTPHYASVLRDRAMDRHVVEGLHACDRVLEKAGVPGYLLFIVGHRRH